MKITKEYTRDLAERYSEESGKVRKYNLLQALTLLHMANCGLENKKVLDAGCGNGYWTDMLQKAGANMFGIDASSQMIELLKKRYSNLAQNVVVGDVTNLPFNDNYFDVILSRHVVHYLPSPNKAYEEFYRCLKNEGLLVLVLHHPISQFMFKKSKNYSKKEIIKFELFKGMKIRHPTHNLDEYLSEYFLMHFDVRYLKEGSDLKDLHSNMKIPDYLLIHAVKRPFGDKNKHRKKLKTKHNKIISRRYYKDSV